MKDIWRWLIATNARTVFGWSIVAMLLVGGFWLWRERTPPDYRLRISKASALRDQRPAMLGVLAFVGRESARAPGDKPLLFRGPYGYGYFARKSLDVKLADPPPTVAVKPEHLTPNGAGKAVEPPSNGEPTIGQPPRAGKQQTPPRGRETVALTYRGLLRRPDGKEVALIQNTKTRGNSFHAAGEQLFGVKVVKIQTDSLDVEGADGSQQTLLLGSPMVFEEGKRAD